MNENGTKRREWVKNAAIIFLSVLLVLTFFSNTIMNYSLPEVAAQYIMSDSITAKIRGTGTIESEDPYNVVIGETRKIESILVRVGDTVQKGDVLFVLADKESDELKAAEDALEAARLEFEKSLLSGNVSTQAANNVQTGKIVYWEHAGRMDDPYYVNDFIRKINLYIKHGMLPGLDFAVSYET